MVDEVRPIGDYPVDSLGEAQQVRSSTFFSENPNMKRYSQAEVICFANDNDALIPEVWAREALAVLASNMVMGGLVNRDFNSMVADYGDVVNTSRPANFVGKRKTDADSVTVQDAVSTNVQVPLNQHLHVSFNIKDRELSLALPNLIQRYLEPAARELAEKVDQVIAGQVARLSTYTAGRLGEMDKTNAPDFVLDAVTEMNVNRAPMAGRSIVMGPRAQKACLGAELFVSAEKRGDSGTALRSASLGTVYGIDSYMDQNMPYVDIAGCEVSTGVVDTGGAEAAGYTGAIDTTVTDADVVDGAYVVFEGDGEAYRVSTSTDSSGAQITVVGGLQHAIAAGADVTVYLPCDVDASAQPGTTYAAGYAKEIILDGHASGKNIAKGRLVTFGTGVNSHTYTVIESESTTATSTTVTLDRPLSAAVADGANLAFVGPAGGMNLVFVKDAVAFVNRPLATVPEGMGARSFVASYGDLAMRVTMQYQGTSQGMLVTFDLLCGVAILDDRMAVVLYS